MLAKLEERVFLAMLVVVTLAFGLVTGTFLGFIFWACAITVIFYPVHIRN